MPPMVQAKFSDKYWAVRKRIQRLPQYSIGLVRAAAKKDAVAIVNGFKIGIEGRLLGLKPLKPATIKHKEDLGQQLSTTPLYGEGAQDKNALVNCLEIVDVKKAIVIRPRAGNHTTAADPEAKPVTLKVLFDVHEYGALITNGFGKGILIRIPPRPALRYAYRQYMAHKKKLETSIPVQKAITAFVAKGDKAALERVQKKLERGAK